MQNAVEALPTTTTPTCAVMGNMLLRRLEMTSTLHAVERPATTNTRKSVVQETTLSGDMPPEESMPSAVTRPVTTTTPTCAVMGNTLPRKLVTSTQGAVERRATTGTLRCVALSIKW